MRRSPRFYLRSLAEQRFPFRADIQVPAGGFGERINAMGDWLAAALGPDGGRHQRFPAPMGRGRPEAVRYYFRDREDRDRFLAEAVPAGLEAEPLDRPDLEEGKEGA